MAAATKKVWGSGWKRLFFSEQGGVIVHGGDRRALEYARGSGWEDCSWVSKEELLPE